MQEFEVWFESYLISPPLLSFVVYQLLQAMPSQVQQKFYNLFWNNLHCRDIFLLHKEELLKKEEVDIRSIKKHYYQKRFVISNSLKNPDAILRIEQRLQDRRIDLNASLQHKSDKNLPENKITQYFTERFGKTLEMINQNLNGSSVKRVRFIGELLKGLGSEKRFIQLLRRYGVISTNIKSVPALLDAADKFIEKELKLVLNSDHFTDIVTAVDEVANHYNNYNYNSLLDSHDFYSDILFNKENIKERLMLFDSLYECKVLEGGIYKTYYECTQCSKDVFSGNVTLNVTPSKVKLKCPNCEKAVFYLAPYKLHDDIFSDIISKDGLIQEALCSLLSENKIIHLRNPFYGKDIEVDIQLMNKNRQITDIIELKMYKSDRPNDVLITNLSEGFSKFMSMQEKLKQVDSHFSNVRFHFLTNLTNKLLIRELKTTFKNQLLQNKVTIHSMDSMYELIGEMADSE